MANKNVSMKDIAHELGVSVALVSYVLNGKKTDKINNNTAARIKALAAKMNYSPNQIAQSLKTNRTHTLGLIVADISNLFYSSIAKYIEEQAIQYGYHVIYGSAHEDPDRFNAMLQLMISRQVDGLILAVPEKAESCIPILENLNKPFVIIDRKFYEFPEAPSILLDNIHASKSIVEHFADNGFKRLGVVTISRSLVNLQERKQGFIAASEALLGNTPFIYELEEGLMNAQIEDVINRAIFTDKVDDLCFFTNKVAMTGLSKIASIDIAVPEKLGIVCFDEANAYDIFKTPISYFKQPLHEMSITAIDFLLGQIEHKENQVMEKPSEFKGSLVVQKSSIRVKTKSKKLKNG